MTDLAEGHRCVGRTAGGLVVFVDGPAAVGDRITAKVYKIKKKYLEARMDDVLDPAPTRTDPPCRHFGVCGGCKWQHVQYEEQLRMKQKLVRDALVHIGGMEQPEVAETIASPDRFHYRNKVDFTFSNERFLLEDELDLPEDRRSKPSDFAIGFHRPRSFRKVIDIDRCHIATERMNRALDLTRDFFRSRNARAYSTRDHEGYVRNLVLREAVATGDFMVYLVVSGRNDDLLHAYRDHMLEGMGEGLTTLVAGYTKRRNLVAYAEELETLHGPGIITEKLGELVFDISPNAFFQTNSRQALRMYQAVQTCAGLTGRENVLDLYCGTGTIGLFLAGHALAVTGFEWEESAVANARQNAERNRIANACFHHGDLKNLAALWEQHGNGRAVDVVITDPPRAGMHADTVASLREMKPKRIVYVSCNPANLARDTAALCANGLYRIGPVQPMDLFPHTYHVESVATLDRA